uniref:ubiquitinyl hydrolase 1 n=1 Tax=Dracunculus medinensis TaxID=318479 RepID=A0A0N4U8E6_DRAME
LQCLAAIESFAEYFVLKKYVKDLKEKNRLQQQNSHQFGTDGLITTAFANLLRSLWFNEPTDSMIRYFRSLIGHFNGDYRTSTQQDAQELLVWLLDKIHEDLNLATSRKYKDVKVSIFQAILNILKYALKKEIK